MARIINLKNNVNLNLKKEKGKVVNKPLELPLTYIAPKNTIEDVIYARHLAKTLQNCGPIEYTSVIKNSNLVTIYIYAGDMGNLGQLRIIKLTAYNRYTS